MILTREKQKEIEQVLEQTLMKVKNVFSAYNGDIEISEDDYDRLMIFVSFLKNEVEDEDDKEADS